MTLRSIRALLAVVAIAPFAARPARPAPAQASQAAQAPEAARTPWPDGALREERVSLAFGLRLVGGQSHAAAAAMVRRLAKRHLPGVRLFDLDAKARPEPPALGVGEAQSEPVDPRALQYFGRGLDDAAKARLAKPHQLTVVVLGVSGDHAAAALRKLTALVAEAARSLGAVVDDPEARLYYSATRFQDFVAQEGFEGDLPVVERHVAIHSYEWRDGLIRSITLGMSKLGLPDVVVNGHGQHGGPTMVSLIHVVAQTMAERGKVDASGRLDVDLRTLRSRTLREPQLASLKKGGTARGALAIAVGRPEQGDSANRLLELTFEGPRGTATERQNAVLAGIFGAEDEAVSTDHDAALLAESARARANLLALKPRWQKGHAVGERLMVKAPFQAQGGDEYMWIDVTGWQGTRIRGLLANDPVHVPGLRAGASIEVDETSVFDYLLRRPDGTTEGNTTAKLLRRR